MEVTDIVAEVEAVLMTVLLGITGALTVVMEAVLFLLEVTALGRTLGPTHSGAGP